MQTCSFDVIGTHLDLRIDSLEDCDTLFAEIRGYLARFEVKYSRFLE